MRFCEHHNIFTPCMMVLLSHPRHVGVVCGILKGKGSLMDWLYIVYNVCYVEVTCTFAYVMIMMLETKILHVQHAAARAEVETRRLK